MVIEVVRFDNNLLKGFISKYKVAIIGCKSSM